MKRAAILVAALLAAACSSGGSAQGTVSGTVTVDGGPVELGSVGEGDSFVYSDTACSGTSQTVVGVALSARSGVCSALSVQASMANNTELFLTVSAASSSGGAAPSTIANGTYSIGTPTSAGGAVYTANATLEQIDGACATTPSFATSGSITLTNSAGAQVNGSFTATFGSSGTFTGTFAAPTCQVDATNPDGGTVTYCDLGQTVNCEQ